MLLYNKKITINGRFLNIPRLKDEWYDEIENPALFY